MTQEERIKHTCFICGYRTLDNRCDWDICPICFWEDDVWLELEDKESPANAMMVSEAQSNFIRFGAKSQTAVQHVRKPGPDDQKDPKWRPLPRTLELLELTKRATR
jgi:Cysteine-rich CPCC